MAELPAFALGCRRDPFDPRDRLMGTLLRVGPVASRVDHSAQLPPIMNQGPAGTCAACATAYYDKGFQEGREHLWDLSRPEHQFSPLFIYSQRAEQPGDNGMSLREAMRITHQRGACPCAKMPYDPARIDVPPTTRQLAEALPFRAAGYARLNTLGEMLAYLRGNCFVAGLEVRPSFVQAPDGRIPAPCTGEPILGGHALCICGYDLRLGEFIFANSWGCGWGMDGFGSIPFEVFTEILMDAWGMVDAPDPA